MEKISSSHSQVKGTGKELREGRWSDVHVVEKEVKGGCKWGINVTHDRFSVLRLMMLTGSRC